MRRLLIASKVTIWAKCEVLYSEFTFFNQEHAALLSHNAVVSPHPAWSTRNAVPAWFATETRVRSHKPLVDTVLNLQTAYSTTIVPKIHVEEKRRSALTMMIVNASSCDAMNKLVDVLSWKL